MSILSTPSLPPPRRASTSYPKQTDFLQMNSFKPMTPSSRHTESIRRTTSTFPVSSSELEGSGEAELYWKSSGQFSRAWESSSCLTIPVRSPMSWLSRMETEPIPSHFAPWNSGQRVEYQIQNLAIPAARATLHPRQDR